MKKRLVQCCFLGLALLAIALFSGPKPAYAVSIALRAVSNQSASTNTSVTIPVPTGTQSNDLLIASIVKSANTGTITAPAGWSPIGPTGQATLGAGSSALFYKVAGTESGTYVFTWTGTTKAIAGSVVAFLGVDTSAPFDVSPLAITTGNSASPTVNSLTTNSTGAAVIMFGQAWSGNTVSWSNWAVTSPGSLKELYANTTGPTSSEFASVGAAWGIKVTPGATGSATATLSAANNWGAILIALKPLTPTAVTVSDFSAEPAGSNSFTLAAFLGVLGIITLGSVAFVFARKR